MELMFDIIEEPIKLFHVLNSNSVDQSDSRDSAAYCYEAFDKLYQAM